MWVLQPFTLSSGPESGLVNQIWALIGYCFIARHKRFALLLPDFTSHKVGGSDIAFEDLWDAAAFIRSLATLRPPLVALAPSDCRRRVRCAFWRPHADGRVAGWRYYKRTRANENTTAVESAVLRGLRPSVANEQRIERARDALGLAAPGVSYGCLHARIEGDMAASWTQNRAGAPPTLVQLLGLLADAAAASLDGSSSESAAGLLLRQTPTVLVAVGAAVAADDEALLTKRTAWGARLVRTATKAWHLGGHTAGRNGHVTARHFGLRYNETAEGPSYTHTALVDFQLCRAARWFVGWPGSSFARTLGRLRELERAADAHHHQQMAGEQRGASSWWLAACPSPAKALIRVVGWATHDACARQQWAANRTAPPHDRGAPAHRVL